MGKKVTRALVILSIVGFAMVSVSSSVAAQAMANQDTNTKSKKQNDSARTDTAVANPKGAQTPASEQTDLTGTYTGTFDCEAAGISGETTLTINGNQFTTADGKSGRIVATTTSGYTAVAMQIG